MNQKTTARVRIHAVAVLGSRLPAHFVSLEQVAPAAPLETATRKSGSPPGEGFIAG
jgi:hypothetical protein